MTKNIVLAMSQNFNFFIGDLDEEKGVLKGVYKMIHQVLNKGQNIQIGMVDPFMPFSEKENKPIPEMPKSAFVAFREPGSTILQTYLQLTTGLIVPGVRPDGKGGKIVSAHAGEVVRFSDRKKK